MGMDKTFLSVRSAAERLGFSRKHTYDLVRAGKLEAVKVWGGRWKISAHAVEEVKAQKEEAANVR